MQQQKEALPEKEPLAKVMYGDMPKAANEAMP